MLEQFMILKKHEDILTAQHLAQEEFEKFFREFYKHINKSEHVILKEIFADINNNGYLIRIHFTEQSTSSDIVRMQEWSNQHLSNDLSVERRWYPIIYKIPMLEEKQEIAR